jgi:hypothetical protein
VEEYLLRVAKAVEKDLAKWLDVSRPPTYIRVATLSPLSTYGYPPGSEGYVLRINEHGLVTGVEGNDAVPHDFVPWQNISYISDGTSRAEEQSQEQHKSAKLAAAAAQAETAPLREKKK